MLPNSSSSSKLRFLLLSVSCILPVSNPSAHTHTLTVKFCPFTTLPLLSYVILILTVCQDILTKMSICFTEMVQNKWHIGQHCRLSNAHLLSISLWQFPAGREVVEENNNNNKKIQPRCLDCLLFCLSAYSSSTCTLPCRSQWYLHCDIIWTARIEGLAFCWWWRMFAQFWFLGPVCHCTSEHEDTGHP